MAHLAMRNGADGEASANTLTVDRLLSAPLSKLLAEVNAEIVDTSVTDESFFGQVVKPRTGTALLCMPTGRSAFERDTVARILVGKLVGAPMRPVPPSLDVRTYGGTK
ncbi:hypothetical protein [Streptomyces nymphaeiformis]|uniref:Uncharacterized protein n=1 Tax=Streptomyces nymphaeiformis TaxID=2663842 RepID=A0A7W7U4S8_9ACTN|nr:hypothetical protein [Streptomyces nymphaeiformis]MBB4984996.1 hypothetical protein [Streptomyces nymphaeiformis]